MAEEQYAQTTIKVTAPEGETVGEAETLQLIVEGPNEVIMLMADVVMGGLQLVFGGEVKSVTDEHGNDLTPPKLDMLSTGDDSVDA